MADDPSLNFYALDRVCIDDVCHCDWRINLQDCEESIAMWYVNIINIAISGLSAVFGIALLIHRVVIKGHTFWNHQVGMNGILRPKPVDCMLLLFVVFSLLRLLSSAVLVTNAAPGDLIVRSFLYEVPWGPGIGSMTIYLIGIAQTISQSKSVSGWLPSPMVVDVLGIFALSAPVVVGVSLSLGAGAAATNSDVATAVILIRISYMVWSVWVASLGGAISCAAVRLVRILKAHHQKHRHTSNYVAVMSGIHKIQFLAATFVICLGGFGILLFLYCILRDRILANKVASVFAGSAWAFMGGLATLFAEISVVFSPRLNRNAALRSSKKSTTGETNDGDSGESTQPDLWHGGSTIAVATDTFQNDNDAILNAIKISEMRNQYRQSIWGERTLSKFFSNKSRRRGSNASSQLELTAHDRW